MHDTSTIEDQGSTMSQKHIITHEVALQMLLEGNERYQSGENCSSNPCPAEIDLESGQSPFAAFIRCADSRVAPEIVFDQPLGSLFVCGVAGNIPTDEIVASLEYAIAVLGTKLIVIMGHSSCGAVTAAIAEETGRRRPQVDSRALVERIHECTTSLDMSPMAWTTPSLRTPVLASIVFGMSETISSLVETKEVQVIAGVESLKTGRFDIVRRAF